jgi:hypothetical protein
MRRFRSAFLMAALLASATASSARADDGLKEYLDCVKFTTVWCDLTREEVGNVIEYMAVEFWCGVLYLGCAAAM